MKLRNIPLQMGYYLAGFADGEGSFNLSFRSRADYRNPWKLSLCFNVSQRDKTVLELFQKYLSCGSMRQRQDGVWYFEVNRFEEICEFVIPFFDMFSFLSKKKRTDFFCFKEIAALIKKRRHLDKLGIIEILKIRDQMNNGGKRRYSNQQIFDALESSETICQTGFPCWGTQKR